MTPHKLDWGLLNPALRTHAGLFSVVVAVKLELYLLLLDSKAKAVALRIWRTTGTADFTSSPISAPSYPSLPIQIELCSLSGFSGSLAYLSSFLLSFLDGLSHPPLSHSLGTYR